MEHVSDFDTKLLLHDGLEGINSVGNTLDIDKLESDFQKLIFIMYDELGDYLLASIQNKSVNFQDLSMCAIFYTFENNNSVTTLESTSPLIYQLININDAYTKRFVKLILTANDVVHNKYCNFDGNDASCESAGCEQLWEMFQALAASDEDDYKISPKEMWSEWNVIMTIANQLNFNCSEVIAKYDFDNDTMFKGYEATILIHLEQQIPVKM